jgi:ATP synthase proteolipid subunit
MTVDPQLLTGLGAVASIFFSAFGSAHGSAHGGIFAIRRTSILSFVPIVIAGVLSIYGLIVAVLLIGRIRGSSGSDTDPDAASLTEADGYRYLAAGLATGLTCWASGWGMAKLVSTLNETQNPSTDSVVTHSGNDEARTPSRGTEETDGLLSAPTPASKSDADEKEFYKRLILSMIFVEAIGLYGLIVGLVLIGYK